MGPRAWVGGSPLRLFRFTPAGDRLVTDLDVHGVLDPESDGARRMLDRLVDAAAAHPDPPIDAGPFSAAEVTVVIPAKDRADSLERLLGALGDAAAGARGSPVDVIVVDDGSADHDRIATVAQRGGARLVRRATSGGPAIARNDGLARVDTPLVAFLDSDVDPVGDWLSPLLGHFADPLVAFVAPRVRCTSGSVSGEHFMGRAAWLVSRSRSLLHSYEQQRSPLDLGTLSALVRPRSRVAYVPAAALLARTDVMRRFDGFDASLRFGEDVDLVWRAVGSGWRVRYEPAGIVAHAPRLRWRDWARQRFEYGTSAALLDERHPWAAAPAVVSPWSAAVWGLGAMGHPVAGAATAGASAAALVRKLGVRTAGDSTGTGSGVAPSEAVRLAAGGHLGAGRQLARAAIRPWWPLLVGWAVVSQRGRRVAAASLAVHLATTGGGPLTRLTAVADDVAYSSGVWAGAVRRRSLRALLPAFPSWP